MLRTTCDAVGISFGGSLGGSLDNGMGVEHAPHAALGVAPARNIVAATEALSALRQRLCSPKTRRRSATEIDLRVAQILEHYHAGRYLTVRRGVREEHRQK